MNDEKIKVNFTLLPESKEMLARIKKEEKYNISTFLDDILRFDDKAVEIFLNIYKNINKERISRYNYLRLEDGGVIYNQATMDKVLNSNIALLTDDAVVKQGFDNSAPTAPMNTEERFTYHEKIMLVLNKDIQSLKNKFDDKIEKLSNSITQQLEEIEKLAIELDESNASLHESSAKKAIISDQELLDAIAEIVLQKIKDKDNTQAAKISPE
ncbi:hypothetical protein [Sulfurimonas sp. RIFOXYB12_FULL_35_9]|jgi:hypothetical protein|uniref:hypothetical protein n=1 Tax=Sulfurimonas sp. RIFOXYB12_FULL_35_9 TaxID=1802256 RepID=UPI0008B354F5|nr:hypothetical protein [Sulfurimonas sp. RIFOXYB12_FULL_35_9]OHE05413.1 MAG: hypothetical protein A2345_01405 [Sulfurimonas sp. RIFOXYB12_FULL_35_9]